MILDLYAGAGGWDHAARTLGLDPIVGLEVEHDPCATAVAAGGRRIRCDVATYPTAPFANRVAGLVASPPCQAWSSAGKRGGEQDRAFVHELVDMLAEGDRSAAWAWSWGIWEDPRSHHAAQPVRWVRDLRPEWVCLEQVPAVLGLWQHIGRVLAGWGYQVWTGLLNAANHGIVAPCPFHAIDSRNVNVEYAGQVYRYETALVIAERLATTSPDEVALSFAGTAADHLARVIRPAFAGVAVCAERERALAAIVASEAPTTHNGPVAASWTTEATSGYGLTPGTAENIALLLSSCLADRSLAEKWSTTSTTTRRTIVQRISKCIAATLITGCGIGLAARRVGCGLCVDVATPQTRTRAFLIASRVRPVRPPTGSHFDPRLGAAFWGTPWVSMADALGWGADGRPAPTVTGGGTGSGGGVEVFAGPYARAAVQVHAGNSGAHDYERAVERPSPTITHRTDRWTAHRPATTVAADPRVPAPGHRDRAGGERQHAESVRVTVTEAAILQGFPADYPWRGTRTSQYQQVGNAVPPPLAVAVLAVAAGRATIPTTTGGHHA